MVCPSIEADAEPQIWPLAFPQINQQMSHRCDTRTCRPTAAMAKTKEEDDEFEKEMERLRKLKESPAWKAAVSDASNLLVEDVESGKVSSGGVRSYYVVDDLPKWYWETEEMFEGDGYPRTVDPSLRDDPDYYQVLKDVIEYGYGISRFYEGPVKMAFFRDAVRKVIRSRDPNQVEIVSFLLTYGGRASGPGEEPLALVAARQYVSGALSRKLLLALKRIVSFDEPDDNGVTANSVLHSETDLLQELNE